MFYVPILRSHGTQHFELENRTHGFVAYLKLKEVFCLAVVISARLYRRASLARY